MTRSFAALLLAAALAATGCDSADLDDDAPPVAQSVAGVWTGPITHPNPALNGTLTLSITQVDRSITGTAEWGTGRET